MFLNDAEFFCFYDRIGWKSWRSMRIHSQGSASSVYINPAALLNYRYKKKQASARIKEPAFILHKSFGKIMQCKIRRRCIGLNRVKILARKNRGKGNGHRYRNRWLNNLIPAIGFIAVNVCR